MARAARDRLVQQVANFVLSQADRDIGSGIEGQQSSTPRRTRRGQVWRRPLSDLGRASRTGGRSEPD
jgi:hypothetical protein